MEKEKIQKQENTFRQDGMIQIGIFNQTGKARDADIWVIQDNQENRKTSSWGRATARELNTGKTSNISVTESPDGRYLIRMIDAGRLYYEANAIFLKNGDTIVIKDGDEVMSAIVEVRNDDGKIASSYDMFVASL